MTPSGGETRCHSRRWACHPSAILALSANFRPDAQGTERTGGDLGLLRATAARIATRYGRRGTQFARMDDARSSMRMIRSALTLYRRQEDSTLLNTRLCFTHGF